MLGAEDPLADDEGLQPQRVQVQADGVQVVAAGELAGVAVLLLGQLDLLGEPRLVPHLARRAPVLDGALRVVVLVQEGGAEQLEGAGDPLGAVVQRVGQILEDLGRPLEAGRLQRVVLVAGLQVRVGAVTQQQLGRLEPAKKYLVTSIKKVKNIFSCNENI